MPYLRSDSSATVADQKCFAPLQTLKWYETARPPTEGPIIAYNSSLGEGSYSRGSQYERCYMGYELANGAMKYVKFG